MLLDAFKSELYRFSKNRVTAFWSLAFVPAVTLIGGMFAAWYFTRQAQKLKDAISTDVQQAASNDLGGPMLALAGHTANVATLAFLLIGAATLFAGDYRWETWRLISARNSRANLLGGKLLTLGVMILAAVAGLMLAGLLVLLFGGVLDGGAISFDLNAAQWGQLGLLVLLGIGRLVQVLLLALLAAVVTRSLMAALFVPIVVSIAQSFAEKAIMFVQIMPTDLRAVFLSPGLATSHLKGAIQGGLPPAIADNLISLSLGSLALWIVVPVLASFALFQRQGMSKE